MIIKKEFLMRLKDLGLNSYEAKLWTALLSRGVSTAGELSDIANVPRSRTYDVLESLERKGFIIMKIGKPIKYMAVPPEEVLERVKKKIIEETTKKSEFLDKLKKSDVLQDLKLLYKRGIDMVDITDLSGALKGRSNLYNHIETCIKGAEDEVIIHTTERGLIRKLEFLKNVFKKLKQRGVKIRIAAPITEENKEYIEELNGIVEIRHSDLKSRFVVVDKKEIIFMVLNDEEVHPTYDVGIWVNTPFFANTLSELFDLAWKEMKPITKVIKSKARK